ncbi:MAG TPA: lectin-like protein [Polyangiaceae bacterium]
MAYAHRVVRPRSGARLCVALLLIVCGVLSAMSGCSGGQELEGNPFEHPPEDGGQNHVEAGPCTEETTRRCGITLGRHGNVLSCYVGTQKCQGGVWSTCADGQVTELAVPSGGMFPQALGPPKACVNNPCDPWCQVYNEVPDAAIIPNIGDPVFTWETGGLEDMPPGLTKKALVQPCQSGADCQFNHYCKDVSTASACTHSKCIKGLPLDAACDPCVAAVCAQDPSCCGTSACAHDVCAAGVKLDPTCNSCAASVCAAKPSCCTGTWDASCVALVNTSCPSVQCGCAPGQLEHNGRCYANQDTSGDWATGRYFCQAYGLGWDLVSINDDDENEFVRTQTNATTWIGFSDVQTEGTWKWSSGASVTYTNWNRNPDNGGDCFMFDKTSGGWDDRDCGDSFDSLCEAPAAPAVCASGETLYNGRCYVASGSTVTSWTAARDACLARGGGWALVDITNLAENGFVQGLTSGSNAYWIGLYDTATENTYRWVTAPSTTVTYFNWATGQPNPSGSDTEDCISFSDTDGRWTDRACSGTGNILRYVCEGPTLACPSGTVLSGGRCYALQTSNMTWSDSRSTCQARGTGWDLVSIDSAAENTLVQGMVSTTTWTGLNDRSSEGTNVWSNGSSSTYRNWRITDPAGGTAQNCAFMNQSSSVTDGRWADDDCTDAYNSFCEGPYTNSTLTWSQSCIDQVATVCDARCGAGSPPAQTGTCTPWLPGETQTNCGGIDLALGVPCENETISVCNHGTQPAPSGVRIVSFSGNSGQYPQCAPDPAKIQSTCVTTRPIPAGECIDMRCPGIQNISEIMVNPPGAGHVNECSCLDNWSLYDKSVTCGAPDCSGAVSEANAKKVNMFFVFDRSGSMAGARWDGSVAALTAFFKDPASAGLSMALEYFPLPSGTVNGRNAGDGCGSDSCSTLPCANPMVALGTLTTAASPTDVQEQRLLSSLGVGPSGSTPAYPAMRGALDWAILRQATATNEANVVIFITDGDPNGCFQGGSAGSTNLAIANAVEEAYLIHDIRTYTVAMEGANVIALDNMARRGGTGQSFVVGASNSLQVAADLSAALRTIAGQNVACQFPLTNQGLFDPITSTVTYTPSSGAAQNLTKRTTSAACGTGWYFDDNTNPTSITLCPSTCATVQADANARVQVHLGCPSGYEQTLKSQLYDGACPSGQGTQWGYLAYDTDTPGNSSVVFQARTAATQADLASAAWTTLATAQGATPDCLMSGPAPCPVDVTKKLGGGSAARSRFLELQLVLNPTSNRRIPPEVHDWDLTYSCPPNE